MIGQPLDLDAIRARAAVATPGPWHLRGKSIQAGVPISDDGPADGNWNHSVVCSVGAWRSGRPIDADAAFIAAARTDVPVLLAEVDRLTRELATMTEVARGNRKHVEYLARELERLQSPTGGDSDAAVEITSITGVDPAGAEETAA